jgi:cytochrome d ubiquinol oxidase subunit II
VYAAAFSGFYFALLLVLLALILRPVGFDFRSKVPDPRWRGFWDWGVFVSGAVPALVFGVAFGNLFQGVPFHYDDTLRPFYTGSFWALLNPFALLVGIVSLSMLMLHGALYTQLRTEGEIADRAAQAARAAGGVFMIAFALAGLWLWVGIDGYRLVSIPAHDSVLTPLMKTVEKAPGGWFLHYRVHPSLWILPFAGLLGAAAAMRLSAAARPGAGIIASGIAVTGTILTAGVALFPFVMPSSTQPDMSLTMWDATSSHWTLQVMFWAVVVFLPLVLAYTTWVYSKVRGKITVDAVRTQSKSIY